MTERRNHSVHIEGVDMGWMTEGEANELNRAFEQVREARGVGWKLAAKTVKEFRTMEALTEASAEDLAVVDGISERLAKNIKDTLDELA